MLRIYAKTPGSKRFQAMDYRAGLVVGNLIYATLFNDEQRGEVEKAVDFMRVENPDIAFEIREVA